MKTKQARGKSDNTKYRSVAIREYLKGPGPALNLDPRIDLTKPVFEQALKLAAEDTKQARKRKKKAA